MRSNQTLTFSVTDRLVAAAEDMRGDVPLDEFLRFALELGLHCAQKEATRASQDKLIARMYAKTIEFSSYREAREVKEPKDTERPTLQPARPTRMP